MSEYIVRNQSKNIFFATNVHVLANAAKTWSEKGREKRSDYPKVPEIFFLVHNRNRA